MVIVCCAISLNHALSPFRLQEVSVLFEPNFGHLRFHITDLPPQQRSPSERNIVRGSRKFQRARFLTTHSLKISFFLIKEKSVILCFHFLMRPSRVCYFTIGPTTSLIFYHGRLTQQKISQFIQRNSMMFIQHRATLFPTFFLVCEQLNVFSRHKPIYHSYLQKSSFNFHSVTSQLTVVSSNLFVCG